MKASMTGEEGLTERVRTLIAQQRPSAVAGWPEYWARLLDADLTDTTLALDRLADQGVIRRQPLDGRYLYIADPPHAPDRPPLASSATPVVAGPGEMPALPTIELVTFRLRPEVSETTFHEAVAASTHFLTRQPGFLHREVARSATGEWTDIVHWATMEDALRAAAHFNAAPETRAFNSVLERQSVQRRHLRSRYQYRRERLAEEGRGPADPGRAPSSPPA